jgi:hydroxymethylbilane synthase
VVTIGSRGSALALWQTNHVRDQLQTAHNGLAVEIEIIQTTGDKILDVPLSKIGDKGLFTKELDRALLDRRVDLAVHSLKDIPTKLEPGLIIAAIGKREDPSDALIAAPGVPGTLEQLPKGARVGTSSLRRRAQLKAVRPDLDIVDLRGNLDTRLKYVQEKKYDAIILAHAGMKRLGVASQATEVLNLANWLPAVGQGALGIICREDDTETRALLRDLDHADTHIATTAERSLLRELEGGCQIPIAAHAVVNGDSLSLRALVASVDGERIVRGEVSGDRTKAEKLGSSLAHDLLERGARGILDELRNEQTTHQITPP